MGYSATAWGIDGSFYRVTVTREYNLVRVTHDDGCDEPHVFHLHVVEAHMLKSLLNKLDLIETGGN